MQLSTSPHTSVIKQVLIRSITPRIFENILCMRQQNLIFTNLAMVSPHYFGLELGLVPHQSSWSLLILMLFPLKKDCSVVECWNMDEGIWVLGFRADSDIVESVGLSFLLPYLDGSNHKVHWL